MHPLTVDAINEIRVLVVMFATRPVMEETVLTVMMFVTNVNDGANTKSVWMMNIGPM